MTPSSETIRSCNTCGVPESRLEKQLKYCTKCLIALYCSPECQKVDWRSHKRVCAGQTKATTTTASTPKATSSTPASASVNSQSSDLDVIVDLLSEGHLHQLTEIEVFAQLIDCFRIRVEDAHLLHGGQEIGVYAGQDPRPAFSEFLDRAERNASGILPAWWSAEKREECQRMSVDSECWHDINCVLGKTDIVDYYADGLMPMKLRALGNKIYGVRLA